MGSRHGLQRCSLCERSFFPKRPPDLSRIGNGHFRSATPLTRMAVQNVIAKRGLSCALSGCRIVLSCPGADLVAAEHRVVIWRRFARTSPGVKNPKRSRIEAIVRMICIHPCKGLDANWNPQPLGISCFCDVLDPDSVDVSLGETRA